MDVIHKNGGAGEAFLHIATTVDYSSPRLLKLAWPLRPITRWSWMEMPSASAAVLISRVISMSSRDG
jgi:hypothetical protein